MTPDTFNPTAYPEINGVLRATLAEVRGALAETFVGVYLHGSLAGGDFAPERSDIDLLVVTEGPLDEALLPELAALHRRVAADGSRWAAHVECSYIPRRGLRRFDPADMRHPALRIDGSVGLDDHGSDWVIQRHLIRERGITLAGPDPRTLIDPVAPDELRAAARGILREWWEPQLRDHALLASREYQAYAVLTMCRSLYTLRTGSVATQLVAARWAEGELGSRWSPLIEGALAWPSGPQPDALEETLALMRLTLAQALADQQGAL